MINKITKVVQLIYYELEIKRLCRKNGISRERAEQIIKSGTTLKKKKAAKRISILKKKQVIVAILLLVSIIVGIIVNTVISSLSNTDNIMKAVASYFVTASKDKDAKTLFKGEAICDLDGKEPLSISSDMLKKAKTVCDGTNRLVIEYKSYETVSMPEDNRGRTIIAMRASDEVSSMESNEAVQETESNTSEDEGAEDIADDSLEDEGNDTDKTSTWLLGKAYEDESYTGALKVKSVGLTSEKKEEYIVLNSSDSEVLEKGLDLYGYNWIITKVELQVADKETNWTFSDGTVAETGGLSETGLVPKDNVLKNWYYFISDAQQASDIVGGYYTPWIVLGTMLRETQAVSNSLNNSSFTYIMDLDSTYSNGADVSSGQLVQGSAKNGWGQFNQKTWDGQKRALGSTDIQELYNDSELGFYRPNCWYGRDDIWTTVFYSAGSAQSSKLFSEVTSSDSFINLDEVDKQFIVGCMAEGCHNQGNVNSSQDKELAYKLIDIAQNKGSYGMSSLADMCDVAGVTVVNLDRCTGSITIQGGSEVSTLDSKFSLGIGKSSDGKYYRQYGYIMAMCAGYKLYTAKVQQIEASEKEGGGTSETKNDVASMGQYVFSTWRSEGYGYGYGQYVNSPTFGHCRIDCSGFVSLVLYQLGLIDSTTQYTSGDFLNNTMGYTVVDGLDNIQAGDIIAWSGHVAMFAGYDGNGNRTWYSWGSNKSCKEKDIPDATYDRAVVGKINSGTKVTILRAQ